MESETQKNITIEGGVSLKPILMIDRLLKTALLSGGQPRIVIVFN